MRVAMEAGFKRALSTITDANVSVIITAGILTVLGSGPVRGFAISLGVGVVVSMFTAITVSHSCCAYLLTVTLRIIHSGLVRISLQAKVLTHLHQNL